MIIKIYSGACKSCYSTCLAFEKAAKEIDRTIYVEIITDVMIILKKGIFQTPAIEIDDVIVCIGKHFTENEAKQLIKNY